MGKRQPTQRVQSNIHTNTTKSQEHNIISTCIEMHGREEHFFGVLFIEPGLVAQCAHGCPGRRQRQVHLARTARKEIKREEKVLM